MSDRRDFVKALGLGALGSLALGAVANAQSASALNTGSGKKIRVGIIGAENSHTIGFGEIFNKQKKFPGVEVVALWGETDEFAKNAAEKGAIPKIVKEQKELFGLIDALIVDHRHAMHHVAAAAPFVQAGIPTFVDKPFAYRVQEAQHLIDLAEKHKTPITCLSSAAFGPGMDDVASQVQAQKDKINSLIVTGPADPASKYGGIFFYGIHTIERLFKMAGDDCTAVRCSRNGKRTSFEFKFASGLLATYVLAQKWEQHCVTDEGLKTITPSFESKDSDYMYAAIVKMFQTGEEPRSHASILKQVSVLEAMERSVSSQEWETLLV
jgi:hypothetical protein